MKEYVHHVPLIGMTSGGVFIGDPVHLFKNDIPHNKTPHTSSSRTWMRLSFERYTSVNKRGLTACMKVNDPTYLVTLAFAVEFSRLKVAKGAHLRCVPCRSTLWIVKHVVNPRRFTTDRGSRCIVVTIFRTNRAILAHLEHEVELPVALLQETGSGKWNLGTTWLQ